MTLSTSGDANGRQSIVTSGGIDVVQDMLMLGSGHGDDEGAVDHALMLLSLLMRDADVAYMFTVQVLPSTPTRALPAPQNHLFALIRSGSRPSPRSCCPPPRVWTQGERRSLYSTSSVKQLLLRSSLLLLKV
jgi:hypothetical protein